MYSTALQVFTLPTQSPVPQNLCRGDLLCAEEIRFVQMVFPDPESSTLLNCMLSAAECMTVALDKGLNLFIKLQYVVIVE